MAAEEAQVQEAQDVEIVLSEETLTQVRQEVMRLNPDKTEDELADQFETAQKAALERETAANATLIAKYKELSALEENKGKTQDEIAQLAMQQDVAEPTLGDDYFAAISAPKADNSAQAEQKQVELPEDVRAELEAFRAMKSDPIFDAYIKTRESGGDFLSLIRTSGLVNDVRTLSASDIYRAHLVQMKSVDPSITDDVIAEEMENFEAKSTVEKAMIVQPTREKLIRAQEEAAKKFNGGIAAPQRQTVTVEQLVNDLRTSASKLKTDNFLGIVIDDAKINEAAERVKKGSLAFRKADGTHDSDAAAKAELILGNIQSIVKTAYEKGMKAERDAEAKRRGNAKSPIRFGSVPQQKEVNPNAAYTALVEKARKAGVSVIEYSRRNGKQGQ